MNIKIRKSDGSLEDINFNKIRAHTQPACEGLEGVSFEELEHDAKIYFVDGMSSDKIQEALILTAVDKIDIDRPNWTFVAARLKLQQYYRDLGYYRSLEEYLDRGIGLGKIRSDIKDGLDIEELNNYIDPERDKQFNYLGITMFYDRYVVKDNEGKPIGLPQYHFMGIAMSLAANEKREDRTYWAKKFYDLMSKFEVMVATPTLSQAQSYRRQMSSCFVGVTPDNIEGIFDSYKQMAILSKYGGGLGWDWTAVRAMGSTIDNHKGVAGGTIPFLKIANDLTIAVDQLGSRPGALTPYISSWHLDIEDYLKLKKNSGEERRRTHDLFPAVWIDDVFMERVIKQELYTLFDPYEVPELIELYGDEFKEKYEEYEKRDDLTKRQVYAHHIWRTMLNEYFETGNPFLVFKDNANRRHMLKDVGPIRSSNLCLEIFQHTRPNTYSVEVITSHNNQERKLVYNQEDTISTNAGHLKASKLTPGLYIGNERIEFIRNISNEDGIVAVCNLLSINLSRVNTKEDIERVIPTAVRMLDNVVSLNRYPVKEAYNSRDKFRAIGLGMMGETEMLAKKGIEFGTREHLYLIDEIYEMIAYNTIKASHNLGIEKGVFDEFKNSEWSKGKLPIDTINENTKKLVDRPFTYDWEALRAKVKIAMRNGYLMAIAPTSSISLLTGTTQAIEPVFKRLWIESNKTGEIKVTAPGINLDNYHIYKPAIEFDQKLLVYAASIRQKWIDQGQSLNIFLDGNKELHINYLSDIYISAWLLGIKSTYYLRSTSPEQIKEDRSLECSGCQ